MRILITGSSGLIGSEAVTFFDRRGDQVFGMDNNGRRDFFGPGGDTRPNLDRLRRDTRQFDHHDIDIRDRNRVIDFFREHKPEAVIHAAAQPSHDLAKDRPFDDFETNAVGTLNLLEAARTYAPEAPFVYMSTNKVYGDAPNEIPLVETDRRYDYADEAFRDGIDESMRIDQSKHSLFGASKAAADLMTQEYGRYFGMPTMCFRGGCLTGSNHAGVELHGFLNYLVKVAVAGGRYTIFGYKGKQVRDQIHSDDVVRAIAHFIEAPRSGEVYNLGGGRECNASILECIDLLEQMTGTRLDYVYDEESRSGDHICYISNMGKFRNHYPQWDITKSVQEILQEQVDFESRRK